MHYFTALGITVAIFAGLFIIPVLAVPLEVISPYFTPVMQILMALVSIMVYLVSLRYVRRLKTA